MKKNIHLPFILSLFFLVFNSPNAGAYKILYAEQYYRLYHQHMNHYPEDTLENIHYLGMALRSDFANPLNAMATIQNQKEWEKYRYLFTMHVNLKLVEAHLELGMKYDKRNAYFYNYPWKFSNLDSLDTAQECYEYALHFWRDAKKWSLKTGDPAFAWMFLEDIQFWEDESWRIRTGDLNYEKTINRELKRLEAVRRTFEAMDETSY